MLPETTSRYLMRKPEILDGKPIIIGHLANRIEELQLSAVLPSMAIGPSDFVMAHTKERFSRDDG